MRRLIGPAALCALTVTVPLPRTSLHRGAIQSKDAAAILAAARQALGGQAKIDAVKTIVANGRTRQVRGENLVPIEFEISIALPDKYLRKDEIPAQESGPNASGFNGDELLQDPPPPSVPAPSAAGRGPAGPPRNPSAARVATLKQDFSRLMLGLFATSYSAYPLTFSYVAEAEAPQGTADVLEAKAADGFAMRLFISTSTHLPVMITWQAPAGRGSATGRVSGPPPDARAAGGRTGGPAPENRLYFAEYQDVNGLQLPFRIRRAAGADTIEETTFDRYRINAKIDPKRFEVHK